MTETSIAMVTQHASHFSGCMVVIYHQIAVIAANNTFCNFGFDVFKLFVRNI